MKGQQNAEKNILKINCHNRLGNVFSRFELYRKETIKAQHHLHHG